MDEFDKMSDEHSCLLEAMEQQSVSLAKAGISGSLAARTTVIAVANPSGGHYVKSKTVSENLQMGSALISRFDLVFILMDQPTEKIDSFLSKHVLALHAGLAKKSKYFVRNEKSTHSTPDVSLNEALKARPGEAIDHLPHVLFRRYIGYAQKYVHPQLTEEAKGVLKQFYLRLRESYHTKDCTPVTARQLESLVRLTQARAKVELRDEATAEDAIDVVEIMRHSMEAVFSDDKFQLDFHRSQNGAGVSNYGMMRKLMTGLHQKAEAAPKAVFSLEELKELGEEVGIPKSKFFNLLQTLNYQGVLIKKGNDRYQVVSV